MNNVVTDLGWLALAIAALSLILTVGRRIGTRLQLRLPGTPAQKRRRGAVS